MAPPQVHHDALHATFTGIETQCDDFSVNHFRGIKYASIPGRFERAQTVGGFAGRVVECFRFGPRCPQVHVDVRHLLRILEDFLIEQEPEDEFECLTIDITCPPNAVYMGKLPVLVWIHGGSQIMTFCSAASKICDPTRLVADSIKFGQPFIFASINYRLNIFSFGDGSETNLAIKDQRLGLDWGRNNIGEFGGNPDDITFFGESAGAVYVHAHLITDPPVKRAVLASGSLYLSLPLPVERGNGLIKALEAKIQKYGESSLRKAPVPALLQALKESNVNTMWIQEADELKGWETAIEQVDEIMIGDTEYESVIWRNGIETLDGKTIAAAFEQDKTWGTTLRKLYQVVPDRPIASKLGALDLLNDARFTLPIELISDKLNASGKRIYKFVVDQPHPWQASSRSHHAVDILFMFGGVDLSFNPAADAVGKEMRSRMIQFVAGGNPWSVERRFAYGPFGECKEISETQFAARRRAEHLKILKEAGIGVYMSIVSALTVGKISLLN